MPDMYDKLGDMLNEALESGKIPVSRQNESDDSDDQKQTIKNENDQFSAKNNEETGHFSFKRTKKLKKTAEKEQIPVGQVIKLHKYTYNMQFPPHIQKALTTLDIVYPFTQKDISKQYHKLLKENHPDTKKTTQTSQSVQNIRQKTVDEITEAYKNLCDFFGIK